MLLSGRSDGLRETVEAIKTAFADVGGATVLRVESARAFHRRRIAAILREVRAVKWFRAPKAPFRPSYQGRAVARAIRAVVREHLTQGTVSEVEAWKGACEKAEAKLASVRRFELSRLPQEQ